MNIPLSFRQIEILLAVAETGSTAAASRTLNTSQPSISLAISRCEEVFGQKIFMRIIGRGMELTPFGQRKIAQLHELERQARWVLGGKEGNPEFLNLGVFSTLGPRYAPQLVRKFKETHPAVEIRFLEGDLQTLFNWLGDGRIDIALIYDFGVPSDFAVLPLKSAEPYALLPQGHRLEQQRVVSNRDLAQDPIILMNLPHSRGYFLSLLQNDKFPVRIAHETGAIEMLRSMVANGFGIGLLATDLPSDITYDGTPLLKRPIKGRFPVHQIALAHGNTTPKRKIIRDFSEFAKTFFAT
ncbi:LysR family transcriptional regulator [Aliiroseovarius crassostreae]|uniref:LysR family transcriptional regulator n=1 Tax=Aliiroseovarius crassostreae TaxID=154981 RepID=UPI0021FD76BA|nr:LysR family transcriptional regulator [Aliiroseovarius crassostreae]UWQ04815.1 LysR family transcriptional regulator [Aliiroseovarius crassostreae]